MEAIKQIGVDRDRVAYLIPSHIHLHHIGAVNVLMKEFPQAKVVLHRRAVPHLMEPTKLNESTLWVWGEKQACPQIDPVAEDRIRVMADGGEVIDLGGRELELIETLGHSPHHISIFDRLTKVLFAGDAVGILRVGHERADPDIRPPLFEMEQAAESLHRLRALKPSMLQLFGYGGVSHSPDKSMQWSEEDIRAVERICREGMEQKKHNKEIAKTVHDYFVSVGVADPTESRAQRDTEAMAGPWGMYAYVKKNHPDLEMPSFK